ncbi:hypothetical protein LOK49_LG01G03642 [Camellia lanceoleosa]|uniref:Uncharacterized protein n=1 Tax=Camellia lanceoleosa TaxID=1840588 RepID=A0ACC0IWT7_9ERIC|nr:hypothetical protein LOK49_LG01G03642 [Camellia lanceoleosa]
MTHPSPPSRASSALVPTSTTSTSPLATAMISLSPTPATPSSPIQPLLLLRRGSSADLDHVDLTACHRHGTTVTNTSDAFFTDSTLMRHHRSCDSSLSLVVSLFSIDLLLNLLCF